MLAAASPPVLLFDADCAVCTRSARVGMELGLRAAIVPLQSVDLAALGVDAARAVREIPFVDARARVSYGADAIAAALATGGIAGRVASRVMRTPRVRAVAARVYQVIARHRHRLPGSSAACQVPVPAVRTEFAG